MKEVKKNIDVYNDQNYALNDVLESIKNYVSQLAELKDFVGIFYNFSNLVCDYLRNIPFLRNYIGESMDGSQVSPKSMQAPEGDYVDVLGNVLGKGNEEEVLVDLSSIKSETPNCPSSRTDLLDHCLPQGENQDERLTDLDQLTSLEQKGDSNTIEKVEKLVNFNDVDYM